MNKKVFIYTLFSIILGLIVGSIILILNGANPINAYKVIFLGVFSNPKYISWTIVNSIPIILTGISVAFAFNTGLFNIGAEGQYIVGSIGAFLIGYLLKLPPIIHGLFALFMGAIFGGIWGGIVGFFKAKFKVNEVISSIMMNWIAFYFSNLLLNFSVFRRTSSDTTFSIQPTANIEFLKDFKTTEAGMEFFKHHTMLKEFFKPPINWGLFVAIIVAILIWYVLNRTTLGYQLKAVGFNKYAAEYGGININKNQVISMTIAGAISGLAGAIMVLGVNGNLILLASQEGYGFNGMAVSLIGLNNPILCIPAGFLFSGLNYGGGKLNAALNIPSEVIKVVIGTIIFFIAMPKLFDLFANYFKHIFSRNKEGSNE